MKPAIALLLIIFSFPSAASLPTQGMQAVGSGTMSWLFWDLYDITLYSHSGTFQPQAYPQALSITYLKNIDREDLITATIDQWQHLGLSWENDWVDQLAALWPSVKANESITLLVNQQGESYFYHDQKLLGSIKDKTFANAFTAIWLSPNTSEPKLRKQLINQE